MSSTLFNEAQTQNLTTDLAAKAPLASPAFTGVPTVPTASQGTGGTQAASCGYADAAVAASAFGMFGDGSDGAVTISVNSTAPPIVPSACRPGVSSQRTQSVRPSWW